MSSNLLTLLKNPRANLHNVGNLNDWNKTVLNQGAVATEDMDNFTLVKLDFAATGDRMATLIENNNEKGWLVATPEEYAKEYETISAFYNAQEERVRVVRLEPGVRFECSNVDFHQKDGNNPHANHPLKNGQVVHYDFTSKKFVISNDSTPTNHPDYAGAANKLVLVDKDCVSIDGQSVYRFEVVE